MDHLSFCINEEFYSVGIFAFIGVVVRSTINACFNPGDVPDAYGPFLQCFTLNHIFFRIAF